MLTHRYGGFPFAFREIDGWVLWGALLLVLSEVRACNHKPDIRSLGSMLVFFFVSQLPIIIPGRKIFMGILAVPS